MKQLPLLLFALAIVCTSGTVRAAWQPGGVPVSTAVGQEYDPHLVPDGSGGFIVVWADTRTAGTPDIYAQRVDAHGIPQWTPGGVPVCTATNFQYNPDVVSDGAGGVIIAWQDARTSLLQDVYAQRLDASGAPQWTADGVLICNATNHQEYVTVVSDLAGGAIITWQDDRGVTGYDMYSQRVNGSGVAQWTANGVLLAQGAFDQIVPAGTSDGLGGAIVAWVDGRNGNSDIYFRAISSTGVPQSTNGGVPVCTATGDQYGVAVVSDGDAGAIAVWEDARSGNYDVYAQRFTLTGTMFWGSDGLSICNAANDQAGATLAADGSGGAVFAWSDSRASVADIYAQRVTAAGAKLWLLNGTLVCAAGDDQTAPTVASDGIGGVVVAWTDERSGQGSDIYAQRLDAYGAVQWTTDGVPATTVPNAQQASVLLADGTAGMFVVWEDIRSPTTDLYAQRLENRYGEWGTPEPSMDSVEDLPADQGGSVVVRWTASERDQVLNPLISYYSVWRSTDAVAVAAVADGPGKVGRDFEGTAVWREETAAGPMYWEWVANQNAVYQSTYSVVAATRADSVAGDPATHYFKVLAHESVQSPSRIWESDEVSGYSVDNLAPAPPLALVAERVGNYVRLDWNPGGVGEPDFNDYAVYRASASGVQPVSPYFLGSADEETLWDLDAKPDVPYYYIVTARDLHGNQSVPSNEANVVATPTGVGDDASAPAILRVVQGGPNPFGDATRLRVGLPAAGDLSLDVFDVAGRRVYSHTYAGVARGWRDVEFSGRDDEGHPLAGGVYFCRVRAPGGTVTRKVVITR